MEDGDEEEQPEISNISYNCKQLLEFLSIYEGELQARDVLIGTLQQQQQQQYSSTHDASSSQNTVLHRNVNDSLFRGSFHAGGEHAVQCSLCSNKLLHSAKILQIKRDSDKKLNKALSLMHQRHEKSMQELDMKERRIQLLAKEDEKYIQSLESERDQLLEQLKQRQKDFAELEEQKSEIQDKLNGESEREKLIVLYLLEERKQLMAHLGDLRTQINSSITGSVSSTPNEDPQVRALKEENRRLHQQLASVQAEKSGLQKRLDYMVKDLQQNAFHQQFQFLQPKGVAEKELIAFSNGLIPTMAPSAEHFSGPNRIRNSSSFPQTFGSEDSNARRPSGPIEAGRGGRMPQQFPTNHFEQRQGQQQQQQNFSAGAAIPLLATNSTMVMRRPPPVPRTSVAVQPTQQYRRPSNEHEQRMMMNSTQIQLGQPQTVITRRSTSLPRRIVSSTTTATPQQKQQQYSLQHHRREPSAEHFFSHQQQSRSVEEPKIAKNFV